MAHPDPNMYPLENKEFMENLVNPPYSLPRAILGDENITVEQVLEPVRAIELDENSKYLFVLRTEKKLSDENLDRLITSIRREWTGFLQDDNWKFLILDEGMELETYQFKPKDDNDG